MSGQRAPKTVGDVARRLRRIADQWPALTPRQVRELYRLAETLEYEAWEIGWGPNA